MGPIPGRGDTIRCEKHKDRKRCAVPNRTDGKPCDRFIAADKSGCWHHRKDDVPVPTLTPAPVPLPQPPREFDTPTDTVQEEIEFIALWMREWNVTAITLLSNGTAVLSDEPKKTPPVKVSFRVQEPDNGNG